LQACHPLPGGGLFLLPFGKKSGPNCPLDGFRQLEKLFIHAFSPLFWFDSPRRGVGIGSLSAVRPVKVSGWFYAV